MRRDWEYVMMLLEVTEKLAGHPNLKGLRDDALKDLEECAAEPPQTWVPEAPEPVEEHTDTDGQALYPPTESTVETSKITRRSL